MIRNENTQLVSDIEHDEIIYQSVGDPPESTTETVILSPGNDTRDSGMGVLSGRPIEEISDRGATTEIIGSPVEDTSNSGEVSGISSSPLYTPSTNLGGTTSLVGEPADNPDDDTVDSNDDGTTNNSSDPAAISLVGSRNDDHVDGSEEADFIHGRAGNDQIDGRGGDDKLFGGRGVDAIAGGDGDDEIYGDAGDDELNGGHGVDIMYGGAGNDEVSGGQGDDELYGGGGDDIFYSPYANDHDVVDGGRGSDTIDFLWLAEDLTIDIGEGTAAIDGREIVSMTSIENVVGGVGNDAITGGRQDNIINGGAGDDWIRGKQGADTLTGGEGADSFFWQRHDVVNRNGDHLGVDVITDFDVAEDTLDFGGLIRSGRAASISDMVSLEETEGGTIVSVDFGNKGGVQQIALLEDVFGLDVNSLYESEALLA